MARHLGAFVSSAGGLFNILKNGTELGVNTVMTHPAPPQRWNSQPFKQEVIDKYNEEKKKYPNIEKVYFHGIYLINLANPDKQKWHLSKLSLVHHLELAEKIDADGVVFHTGTFKDWEDENKGYEQVIFSINWIFEHVQTTKRRLYLECAAGAGGKVIGDKFEELQRIYEGIKDENKPMVGFCIDTQHMFAGGYDIVNNLDAVLAEADQKLGLTNIPVIHFNDSKTDMGSNKDRHENLGADGKIGEAGMKGFLNHPKLKDKTFIMETPALDEVETAKQQVEILKSWAE